MPTEVLASTGSILAWTLGALLALFIAAILALAYIGSAHARAVRAMARRLGLRHTSPLTMEERHTLAGERDGYPFSITETTEPVLAGAASDGRTEFQVALETDGPHGIDLMVYPRDSTAIPSKALSIPSEVRVDDAEFLARFAVLGESQEQTDAILTPAMRAAIVSFPAEGPRAHWVFGGGKTRIYWRARLREQDVRAAQEFLPRLRELLREACKTEWEGPDE